MALAVLVTTLVLQAAPGPLLIDPTEIRSPAVLIGPYEFSWWKGPSGAIGAAALVLGLVLMVLALRARRHGHAVCARCGYDLHLIESGACPECGVALRACRRPPNSMTGRSVLLLGAGWLLVTLLGVPLLLSSLLYETHATRRLSDSFLALVFEKPPLSGVAKYEIVRPARAVRDDETGDWAPPFRPEPPLPVQESLGAWSWGIAITKKIGGLDGWDGSARGPAEDFATRLTLTMEDGRRVTVVVEDGGGEHRIEGDPETLVDAEGRALTGTRGGPFSRERFDVLLDALSVQDTGRYRESERTQMYFLLSSLTQIDGFTLPLYRKPTERPVAPAGQGTLRQREAEWGRGPTIANLYRIGSSPETVLSADSSAFRWAMAAIAAGGVAAVWARRRAALGRGL